MSARELTPDEAKALAWLRDENPIQRDTRIQPSGKPVHTEVDISGGHAAILRLLRDAGPLHVRIRQALASALELEGRSILTLRKRARRAVGRPKNSELRPGRSAYEIHSIEPMIELQKTLIEARRPRMSVGIKKKSVTKKEAIEKIGLRKTKANNLRRERKRFIQPKQTIDKSTK